MELCLLNLLILIDCFLCNSYPCVLFESLSHVINQESHVYSWNLGKIDLVHFLKFIPNFPLKHVITRTNLLHIFRTSFFKNTSEWLFLISVQLILFPRLRYTWYSESLNYFSFITPRFSKKVSTKSFFSWHS